MSASVSVTPRITRISRKCDQLIEKLVNIVEIESTEQYKLLLLDITELNELLPCAAQCSMDLMNHSSELESFACESYSMLLTEILEKFGKSHRCDDEIPSGIECLAGITDNVDFIVETMNVLSDVKVIDSCPKLVVQLIQRLLLDESYLIFVFIRMSSTALNERQTASVDQFIQQLVSLPDKIANKMKTNFPETFGLRTFSAVLMVNALKTLHILCQVNKMEQSNVYDMKLLSKLISKVFVRFNCDKTVLMSSLRLISSLAGQETYQESVQSLMCGLQRSAVEIVAQVVFSSGNMKPRLKAMLGGFWKTSSDWNFMLTKKIPLLTFTTTDEIIENLTFFLASEDETTLQHLLFEMLNVWITKSHVNDTTFDQHFYVTKFIVLMTKFLPNPKDHAEKIKKLLFDGIQVHLGSSDKKLQALGMITAETILGILDKEAKEDEKLKFDYTEMDLNVVRDVVQVVQQFAGKSLPSESVDCLFNAPVDSEVIAMMEKLISIGERRDEDEKVEQRVPVVQIEKPVEASREPPITKPKQIELDSDDDEFEAYDDPDDLPSRNDLKRPKYLLDLIQAFTSKESIEDAEKFELAMKSAEEIVQQQLRDHHSDFAVDLLRIFIQLEKNFYMEEDFDDLKMKILVEICSIHPKVSANYLTQEFNAESSNYSTNKRMLMLDVLAETAKKLSKLITKPDQLEEEATAPRDQPQNKLLIKLNEELENRNRKDAQKIIRQRLIAKTRRITTRTKAPDANASVNRFSDVAGWFFFPLVHGFGRKQMIFKGGTNLKDDIDVLLMLKFLNTISVLMLCAENSVIVPKMAKEIVSLSVFLRFHEEAKIRLAVLHMVATVILAVPRKVLANEFAQEINEFMNHLSLIVKSSVINHEPDKECRDFAKQLMGMFHNALYSDE